jgi:hypothetical protein
MYADDGRYHMVKFQNNPHVRVLANELLATRIAEGIGLPVPATELIDVSSWLVENTPELRIRTGSSSVPCQHGLALRSALSSSRSRARVRLSAVCCV